MGIFESLLTLNVSIYAILGNVDSGHVVIICFHILSGLLTEYANDAVIVSSAISKIGIIVRHANTTGPFNRCAIVAVPHIINEMIAGNAM